MNIYFVSAGEVTTYDPIGDGMYVPDTSFLVELIAAPSRNRATYLFWKEHERDIGGLTEQRWQTRLLGVEDMAEGLVSDRRWLWEKYDSGCPAPQELRA